MISMKKRFILYRRGVFRRTMDIVTDKKLQSVEIVKAGNGFLVEVEYRGKDKDGDFTYDQEKFVYGTLDEALTLIREKLA